MYFSGWALKRQQKIADWEARVAELHKKYPRLGEISRLIAQISTEVVLLGMGKGKMGMTREELDHAREALLAEKKTLFKKYNLPENIDKVWWDCPKCEDRGFLAVGEKCTCLLEKEREEQWKLSGLAPKQKEQTFNTFSLKWYEDQERFRSILQQCIEFAEKLCKGEKTENLFLYGSIGTGKTHLCSAIANYVLHSGLNVLYLKIGTLLDLIREFKYNFDHSINNISRQLLNPYRVSLLIVDDLGTEVSTDFVREQLLNLFDERINYSLPWVISSNLSPNEIGTVYEDRFSDRILGTSKVLKFTGASIRELKRTRS